MLEKLFHLSEKGTNVKTTLVAGRVKKPSVILLGLDVIFLLYFILL